MISEDAAHGTSFLIITNSKQNIGSGHDELVVLPAAFYASIVIVSISLEVHLQRSRSYQIAV